MSALDHLKTVPSGFFRFVAIDVETAGRTIDSICQIGLCCVEPDGRLHTFSTYVNPQCRFEPFNIDLHGIGPETVRDAPTFSEAFSQLAPMLNAHPLVQHSRYDERAMEAACGRDGLAPITSYWADSVKIARRAWPELKGAGGHGLANLKQHLGLSFQHHDAGEDARAAAQVVLHAEQTLGTRFSELYRDPQMSLRF